MKKKPTHGTGEPSRQNLPDDPEQSKRFEETARELEAEERQDKFEKVVQTIMPKKDSSGTRKP
ncbi:hypothetical protein [Hydrogenophaga flava]|uniref:hypothetical protein n=1 Tax=Hydrogenophaga flava TaxID=65657 RepID=UPI0012FAAE4A|nr:hypothetical protein [Hydrogenophaga flava]